MNGPRIEQGVGSAGFLEALGVPPSRLPAGPDAQAAVATGRYRAADSCSAAAMTALPVMSRAGSAVCQARTSST